MFVIAAGNPFDGLSLYGPFEDGNEAGDWALEEISNDTWWTVKLIPQDEPLPEIIYGEDLVKGDE